MKNLALTIIILSQAISLLCACGQNYQISTAPSAQSITTQPTNPRILPAPTPTSSMLPPTANFRFAELRARSTNTQDKPIKLVFVIDNSGSMVDFQTNLANALPNLINQISKYNVDISLYTTSANDAVYSVAKPTASGSTYYRYRDLIGTERTTLIEPFFATIYTAITDWFLNTPYNNHDNLKTRTDMTANELGDVKAKVKNAIMNIGTDGSGEENAFCSLGYILTDNSRNSLFQSPSNDRAAFVIISDEDDNASECIKSKTVQIDSTGAKTEQRVSKVLIQNILQSPTADMGQALARRLKTQFGGDGFLVSGIFYDSQMNDSSCGADAQGANYRKFFNELGPNGTTHSICSTDYSVPLGQVAKFIENIETIYAVDLANGEKIAEVWIEKRNGSKQKITDLTINRSTITFRGNILEASDKIIVKIES